MPKSNAVWGIDIGQCALKAMRCVPGDDPSRITVEAFDFIEYPKILSQPEADPVALVQDALKQFLSRNKVRDDRVAISVPGQSGLARFIKLPPVESKKIPDIVHYEARQQIPFALEDVVWDYQQMAGGSEEDGFALETEVGLFAMKRDQAFRALKPFNDAGIEVDIVQLTPLAIYNFVMFDQLQDMPPIEQYDKSDPPPSIIVISLGTDTTDLIITNGYRVWQRNIPLGGNQFTKALTSELKLTFTKAEHLKRNALKAEDPKAVFLAMRPVFNDLVSEVQRSISFFQTVDRSATITRAITLGNAMKLRGLQKYLAQSLGYEMIDLEEYRGLSGPAVLGAPAFKENLLSFAVCYGLALQGLKRSELGTNLIPREIVKDRLIRAKKPWAVAAVAGLLLAFTIGFFGYWNAWRSVRQDDKAPGDPVTAALGKATSTQETAKKYKQNFDQAKESFGHVLEVGDRLHSIGPRGLMWVQLLKGVSQCVPRDDDAYNRSAENVPPDKLKEMVLKSKRIEITSIDCEHTSKLEDWYADVSDLMEGHQGGDAAGGASGAAAAPAGSGPTGEGWIIQITGHHYHNQAMGHDVGAEYVRRTLLKELGTKIVSIPSTDGAKTLHLSMKDLGVEYPVLVTRSTKLNDVKLFLPGASESKRGPVAKGAADGDDDSGSITVPEYDFTIEFVWKEKPLDRLDDKQSPGGEKSPALAGGGLPPANR